MKAVIALSGLAGFLIFGPPLFRAHSTNNTHVIHLDTHVADHVDSHAADWDQSNCKFEAERTFSATVGSGDLLQVLAGSGSLEVVGVDGLREVRATARACASHEEFLQDLRLSSDRDGDALVVESHYPDWSDRGGWGNRYARLDLFLEVPQGMAADLQDSSGEMSISGLGDVSIQDSSGEIEAQSILGHLVIDDSSGEIQVWDVTGNVEIEDGSGEIEVSGVGGWVTISDGSGEINAENIEGSVTVLQDGSGSIEVDGVGGDFTVRRDGSGSIEYQNVAGTVDVPRKRR